MALLTYQLLLLWCNGISNRLFSPLQPWKCWFLHIQGLRLLCCTVMSNNHRCLSYCSTAAFEWALKIWLIHQWTKLISGQDQKLYMYTHTYMYTLLKIPRTKLLYIIYSLFKAKLKLFSMLSFLHTCLKMLINKNMRFFWKVDSGFPLFWESNYEIEGNSFLYLWLPFEKYNLLMEFRHRSTVSYGLHHCLLSRYFSSLRQEIYCSFGDKVRVTSH